MCAAGLFHTSASMMRCCPRGRTASPGDVENVFGVSVGDRL